MASEGRRSAGFADALGDLAGDDWTTKARPEKPRPDPVQMRETAALAGFKSREGERKADAPPVAAPARRRRNYTGRSEQINVRATAEFKARFQRVVDKAFPSDAVAMEKAIELLEKHYGSGQPAER